MNEEGKRRFFIVIRGQSRKKFTRGCIGRVDAETQSGDLIALIHAGGSCKCTAVVKKEDACPLTQHQAQLLLFVSPASRRLEVLCNVALFSAICELAQEDLVVVRSKKGFQPCLIKNLVQIGQKGSPEDLQMLGFELELSQNAEQKVLKKSIAMPWFSASDIVQVAPKLRHHTSGLTRTIVSRTDSMPSFSSPCGKLWNKISSQEMFPTKTLCRHPLEVGSLVEVVFGNRLVYGVIRWIGVLEGKRHEWAGLEMEVDTTIVSDGKFGTKRYFTCEGNRALFVPLEQCRPDSRFLLTLPAQELLTPPQTLPPTLVEDVDEYVLPVAESAALSLLVGRMKGIQGHFNSCYLDATLFGLFSSSMILDSVFHKSADVETDISRTLRRDIVNPLRRCGFVSAKSVMNLRKKLGCGSFVTEEKDPEEFVTVLFKEVLHTESLLKIRSNRELYQEAYTHQIIIEKSQVKSAPNVQELLLMSFMTSGLKFDEVPTCLILQMPRFGKKFKMFPHIIPSTELDITDLLPSSPLECFLCGQLAVCECIQCTEDHKLQPGVMKLYCSTCNIQVHAHPSRQTHNPMSISGLELFPADEPVKKHRMQLFAVLCIKTSHYVSFVKYGPSPKSWLFFDSMADRCGDDTKGYNIPVVRACPEVGDFLSQPEDKLTRADLSQTSELVRRLLCDSYMYLYQSTATNTYQI
ncbi:ubiquitin carboxyl-terminal hydrolase CYLD [Electrophorus electricus]|uniref:ubiquitin carboxyl-terminal hydrolase CYLD n=1 Tax=Electrophorus electricus TaxID=8005 RepID=UPI0015D01195|nr:ubiquitin carboxyl-terminal hydrolase CYLD [Electrophorus electricus]